MRLALLLAAATVGFSAPGCASRSAAVDCASIDWRALGFVDGKNGAKPKAYERTAEACASQDFAADLSAYRAGRDEGLEAYCTSAGGFAAGRKGEDYSGVCSADEELQFLESHALGRKLFALTEARERAVRTYEAAIADLDQHHYLLRVSEKRYAKPSISNEDRENERQDAEFRRREIARIESRLEEMLAQIEATGAALDAYRIELLSMGLEL